MSSVMLPAVTPDLQYFKDVLRANGYAVVKQDRLRVLTSTHALHHTALEAQLDQDARYMKHVRAGMVRSLAYEADVAGLIGAESLKGPTEFLRLTACFLAPKKAGE